MAKDSMPMPGAAVTAPPPAGKGQKSALAEKIAAAGYTPEEVSAALGVDPVVIKRWMNGEIPDPPQPELIKKLEELAATPKA